MRVLLLVALLVPFAGCLSSPEEPPELPPDEPVAAEPRTEFIEWAGVLSSHLCTGTAGPDYGCYFNGPGVTPDVTEDEGSNVPRYVHPFVSASFMGGHVDLVWESAVEQPLEMRVVELSGCDADGQGCTEIRMLAGMMGMSPLSADVPAVSMNQDSRIGVKVYTGPLPGQELRASVGQEFQLHGTLTFA